ncbi:hypothetical protein OUZ56_008305 [Daphnia magna]|uniref:Uncharacterized protein n=1 Tax=Daphnia magna TaxID=35525 RepID=A0ABR0ACK1_9CRUS|nr:hypothetical protein OUZ56_008305 [Daphnia magna]
MIEEGPEQRSPKSPAENEKEKRELRAIRMEINKCLQSGAAVVCPHLQRQEVDGGLSRPSMSTM